MTFVEVLFNTHGCFCCCCFVFSVACDNVVIVNKTYGILESINYPKPYDKNLRCNWTIQATTGNTVNYTFLHLNVTSHRNCSEDYLEVSVLKIGK